MSDKSPLATLHALIARPSLTPADAGCCELIGERLAALGFQLEWLPKNGVTNLWANWGKSGPLVVLAGHTDVVPPGPLDHWESDPFVPTQRGGYTYGRGAADMKSGLAAMLCAVERLLTGTAPRMRLGFLITSDEEGPCRDGTRYVVEVLRQRGIRPAYTIVGEATAAQELGDRIIVGRRGSLGCNLRIHGTQGHVAYPERAHNPIHAALPAFAELCARHWDDGNPHFPATSFQISNWQAGTGASNVIPGHADVVFNFRYAPSSDADELRALVHESLDRHKLKYLADWWHSGEPYFTAPGELVSAVSAAIRKVTGLNPELFTGGGTSDGRFIATLGGQVIEVGPVNETIHKVNERILSADVDTLSQIYELSLKNLAAA